MKLSLTALLREARKSEGEPRAPGQLSPPQPQLLQLRSLGLSKERHTLNHKQILARSRGTPCWQNAAQRGRATCGERGHGTQGTEQNSQTRIHVSALPSRLLGAVRQGPICVTEGCDWDHKLCVSAAEGRASSRGHGREEERPCFSLQEPYLCCHAMRP